VIGGFLIGMSGNRLYSPFLLVCLALFVVTLVSATPIHENWDTQALDINGWTETGGNSSLPTYNFNSSSNGLGCCPTPGFISAKDNNSGGAGNVLTVYAPLSLFTQTAGHADLSEFDVSTNGGVAYYIQLALKQLSNQGNKPLTGNTGKIDIVGANNVTIQANLYNFVACPTCNNLNPGWNLPTENNLFAVGTFNKIAGVGTYNQSLFSTTISNIISFSIEVELHGDGSDEIGIDGFGIDNVPEPASFAMMGGGIAGLLFYARKRAKAKV
jgi:hypothetical protein